MHPLFTDWFPAPSLRHMAYLPRFFGYLAQDARHTRAISDRSTTSPIHPQHNSSFSTSNLFSLSSISSRSQVCINKITGPTACGRAGLYQQFLSPPKAPRYHPPYPHPTPRHHISLIGSSRNLAFVYTSLHSSPSYLFFRHFRHHPPPHASPSTLPLLVSCRSSNIVQHVYGVLCPL